MNSSKVEGIILAAGLSSRLGRNKLLLDIQGKTIIERCILSMYGVCSRIIVVGGHRIEELRPVLDKYSKAELIFNSNYEDGMFSSVKKGLENIRGEEFFITPGDYPRVSEKTYREMLKVNGDIVIPVHQGKNGHPLLMKSYLIEEILANNKLESLRDFIKSKPCRSVNVGDEGILLDVDIMDDYFNILNYKQ